MELRCNKQIMLQNIVFSIALMINILFYRYDKKAHEVQRKRPHLSNVFSHHLTLIRSFPSFFPPANADRT